MKTTALTTHRIMFHSRFTKIDNAANIRRFYVISVERDLFGDACVVKTWGRIGTKGRALVARHATDQDAEIAANIEAKRRRRRGYAVSP